LYVTYSKIQIVCATAAVLPQKNQTTPAVLPQRLSVLLRCYRGYRGIPAIPITVQLSKLQAYCGGPTTGRTACANYGYSYC